MNPVPGQVKALIATPYKVLWHPPCTNWETSHSGQVACNQTSVIQLWYSSFKSFATFGSLYRQWRERTERKDISLEEKTQLRWNKTKLARLGISIHTKNVGSAGPPTVVCRWHHFTEQCTELHIRTQDLHTVINSLRSKSEFHTNQLIEQETSSSSK